MVGEADVTAIVLCGGRSSRMGRDKATIEFEGATLLQRTVDAVGAVAGDVILVRAPGQVLPAATSARPMTTVEDAVAGEGPLFGMATGLAAAHGEWCLLVGVDMPFLQPSLLGLLVERLRAAPAESGARGAVPVAGGRPQPLCSAMTRDALAKLRAHLEAGDRAPMAVAADLRLVRIDELDWRSADPRGLSFVDVDTPEALEAALRLSDKPRE
jgi:molybdopterin-guanine dinucleotide biosynthesis protein A